MITVRFATGIAVQYNSGNYVVRRDRYADIYDRKDGVWIAQAPNDAIIEVQRPCRVYRAPEDTGQAATDLLAALEDPGRRRTLPGYELARIKRALGRFNATRRTWKGG